MGFQVIQEGGNQRRVEIGYVQVARRLAYALGGEADQQAQGQLVGGDGVGASDLSR
jgi:hypothetical protein